ncbi:hypothetical protein AN216_18435 [Streptomyces oceani]|uniref:DUF2690 domain-containing protein n=2 Tax=Streptomyces oceani TaxID=1075402 RepID=A0A1E7JZ89_9ACTN|nr:hypothetical protein AN216_18435 [Streptomyces oceani]
MIATAAVSAAFVLIPVGGAFAGTGPAAPGSETASESTAPSPKGNPNSAKAQAAGVCDDARQIGETGYIERDGVKIASVKQFYSPECKENYSYVWAWESFINAEDDYDVSAGVYSYDQDKVLGQKSWPASNGQEYWSDAAKTTEECTAAVGTVRPAGSPTTYEGSSDKRCA